MGWGGGGGLCLSDVGGDDVGGDDGTAALTVHATTGLQPAARSENTSALGRTREISQCSFVKKFPTESIETTIYLSFVKKFPDAKETTICHLSKSFPSPHKVGDTYFFDGGCLDGGA